MTDLRTDEDLERLLRETLGARAGSVDRPAAWSPAAAVPPGRPHRRWLAPLAAAAAAVAVAGAVLGLEQASRHDHPSPPQGTGTPTRIVSPTPSPSPSPTRATVTLHPTCSTSLPGAWKSAIAAGTTTAGASSAFPLFITADRQILVSRDFGAARDVALVTAGGATRSIYSVPSPEENQVLTGIVEGHRALITVSHLPRNANGVLPSVGQVVLVDLGSGAQRVVATADAINGGRTIDGATLFRGEVYYDVRATFGSRTSAIHRYDATDQSDRVVAHASGNYSGTGPQLLPQGVVWSRQTMQVGVPKALPAPVRGALTTARAVTSLVSDGSAYAWDRRDGQLGYWAPGMSSVKYFRVPAAAGDGVTGVAGHLIVYTGAGSAPTRVLDTRTGADAGLPDVQPFALSGNGLVVAYAFTGNFKESPTAAVRLDPADFPELKC